MTKNELKTGDIVILRNGEAAVVIRNDCDAYILYPTGGYDFLEDYHDDMTYMYPEMDEDIGDIMQVYRAEHGAIGFRDYDDEYPLYERDDTWQIPENKKSEKQHDEKNNSERNVIEMKKDNIFVIAQQFYGNGTGVEIDRNEIDAFLRGYTDPKLFSDGGKPVNKTVVQVPETDNLVIVYDQCQEDEYVNIEFPEYYAKYGEEYKSDWGKEMEMQVSCEIPEIGIRIHTRCFACRMNEKGEFMSLEREDFDKFKEYFI